jgi:hypothetical protein
MTKRIGNLLVIFEEPSGKCELCGTIAELRPYGPNGERICHPCGMKNLPATEAAIKKLLDGDGSGDGAP